MRLVARNSVGCGDLGKRVSVRIHLPEGGFSDVVGVLETCDEERFGVRDRTDRLRLLDRSAVVASRVVPPAPPRRTR